MINVYEAPNYCKSCLDRINVFLGGGITNCRVWQDEVISKLQDVECNLFNPRRKSFDIKDKNASVEQIEWEFHYLNLCDIFCMYFVGDTDSQQPICMYELGRHLARFDFSDNLDNVLICVEPGYVRKDDVYIQANLVGNIEIVDNMNDFCTCLREKIEDINNFWRS